MRLAKGHTYTDGQIKKIKRGLCATPFCRKKHVRNRHYCHSCTKRKYAENNPEKYCYFVLRNNAKRRKKYFDLTFEQFLMFVNSNGYMFFKGRSSYCLSIDRIRNDVGYTASNIRAITVSDNSMKSSYVDFNAKKKKLSYEEAKALAGTPF